MSQNNASEENIKNLSYQNNLEKKENIKESNYPDPEGPVKNSSNYSYKNNNSIKKEDQEEKNNNQKENEKIENENKKEKNKDISYNEHNNQNNVQNQNDVENENLNSKNGGFKEQYISNNTNFDNYFSGSNNENNFSNKIKISPNKNDSQELYSSKGGINISYSQKSNNNNNPNNINKSLDLNKNYAPNINNNHNSITNSFSEKNSYSKNNRKTDLEAFKDIKTFLDRYTKDPRTPLDEWSESTQTKNNTSYLNAVLQLIGHIPNLAFYFLNPENKKYIESHIKKNPLSFVTERLFIHLYPYPEKVNYEVYNTHTYLKILGALNLLYNTDRTQMKNPNDLISFILDTLDKEINGGKINSPISYNKSDPNEAMKAGYDNYSKNIISKNLNWFQLSEAMCQACKYLMYKVTSFNTFNALKVMSSKLPIGVATKYSFPASIIPPIKYIISKCDN